MLLLAIPVTAAEFFSAIEDLPLMQGLSERADLGLEFDTPSGRIVESVASGAVTKPQVLEFYRNALPQLGWRQNEAQITSFVRDGEILSIDFPPVDTDRQTLVRFRIGPQPNQKQ